MGQITYGFWLATVLAGLLFIGLLLNWWLNPTRAVLEALDFTEYQQGLVPEGSGGAITP